MAGIPAASRIFLEKSTDEASKKLNEVVDELVEKLEKYGLKGEIKLQLTVTANKFGTNTVAERTSVIPYAR